MLIPGNFVLASDLGLTRSWLGNSMSKKARSPDDPPFVSLPPETGPSFCFFHPNGRWLIRLQERFHSGAVDYDSARAAACEANDLQPAEGLLPARIHFE